MPSTPAFTASSTSLSVAGVADHRQMMRVSLLDNRLNQRRVHAHERIVGRAGFEDRLDAVDVALGELVDHFLGFFRSLGKPQELRVETAAGDSGRFFGVLGSMASRRR